MENINTPDGLKNALQTTKIESNTFIQKDCRYAMYVRKSTDESDKQIRSLTDQITECRDFAEKNGITIYDTDIISEAESAKEPDFRPKFRKLINDLKSGKYGGVLAWHPDRLARNMKEAGEVIDLVDKRIIKDLKFVSFTFQNDTSGKMLLGITFVLSKEYSDKLSDNVSRGNKRSIEEGRYINKPKHGYYKDSSQRLQPDGENFMLIKEAFALRIKGTTMKDIAFFLNENCYKRVNADGTRTFVKMDKQRVEKFMKDPVYTGVLNYGKNDVENLIEIYNFIPAVSVSDFMKINKLSKDSQLIRLNSKFRTGQDKKADLMRGLVLCSECGASMSAGLTSKTIKTQSEKAQYFYYRCSTFNCKRYNKSIRARVIIDFICDYLNLKPFSSKSAYDQYAKEMGRISDQNIVKHRSLELSLRSKKTREEERLSKIKNMLLSDVDKNVKDLYKDDLSLINKQIIDLDTKIDETKALIEKGKLSIYTYAEFLELCDNMALNIGNTKDMRELDFWSKKMFSNFTVDGKNVIKYTLNQPFDQLEAVKPANFVYGGQGGTRTLNP